MLLEADELACLDGGSHAIRLSRSALTASQIDEGAGRLTALMAVVRS